jgi:hypothetical protein
MDDGLSELWQAVEDGWDQPARHASFIEAARLTEALPAAARRYRLAREADPARAAECEKRLGAIALLALSQLEAKRTPPQKGVPRWFTAIMGVVTVVVVVYVIRMMTR